PQAPPAKPISVLMIKRGWPFLAAEEGDLHDFEADSVDVTFAKRENIHSALRIDPAGEAVIGAAHQRQAVLDGAEDGIGGVLPLRGAFSEPSIVAQVQQKVGV